MATTVGPTSGTEVNDLYVYSVFGDLLDAGRFPYRDFGLEYPPLALVPIYAPRLLGGSFETWFAVEMLVAALAVQALAGALAGRRAAWLMALAPLVLGAQVRTHFDLVPVALVLGALVLFVRDRPVGAMALLGVGTLVKLFPLALAPVAAAWLLGRGERGTAVRGLAVCAAIAVAGSLPFLIAGGYDGMVRFHLDRPVQIESTPATVLFGFGGVRVTGTDEHPDRFKSNGLEGGDVAAVEALFAALLLATLVLIVVLAARGGRDPDGHHLVLCTLAALLAFVALGKVLSPQYMIWLAPFAAIAWAWREHAVAVPLTAAMALTQVWFPGRYFDLVARDHTLIAIVAVRNALLLMALGATARALARSRPRARPASSG